MRTKTVATQTNRTLHNKRTPPLNTLPHNVIGVGANPQQTRPQHPKLLAAYFLHPFYHRCCATAGFALRKWVKGVMCQAVSLCCACFRVPSLRSSFYQYQTGHAATPRSLQSGVRG